MAAVRDPGRWTVSDRAHTTMADLKLALRTLSGSPFLTAVAVLSLALGIGANAAIFSLFDQILLRPLPVEDPDALVSLGAPGPKQGMTSCNQSGGCDEILSYPMYRDLERAQQSLTGLAAHRSFGANLSFRDETVSGRGVLVSGSYFPVLGIRPALGRLLDPGSDRTIGGHPVTVLSHRFWESRLGADPGIIDETIVVNGQPFTVVGVGPEGFDGTTLGSRPDLFVPLTMRGSVEPSFDGFDDRKAYWAYVFGRLKPGVTVEQARSDLNGIYRGIIQDVEVPLQEGFSEQAMARFRAKELVVEVEPRGQSSVHGEARTPLILLFSITGVVLVIACANIANLLLARGAGRAQEMAIRGSLGARRSRLLRQLLTESLVLAVMGGAAGILVARWTLDLIGSLLPPEVLSTLRFELSPPVFLFAAAAAVGTGIVFGLYPAFHATRMDLAAVLKDNTGQPSGARSAARFRTALVTAQIALSMALLVAAGLFIRSLGNISRVDLGIRTDDLVTFGIAPELNGYEQARSDALFRRAAEELAALPGAVEVSSAMVPALGGNSWGNNVSVEGFERGPDVDTNSRYNAVGPRYFSTLGMSVLAGRDFTAGDVEGAGKVAVVNEAFARKFGLGGREAVGKWMTTGNSDDLDIEIVGLVADAGYSDVKDEVPPVYFVPHEQQSWIPGLTFYVRTAGDPSRLLRAIPEVIEGLDPNLPVNELKTMEQQVRENVFLDRMIGTLSAAFAALATLLAAVGLYGVLAYTVAQRTREIGLRMALGAGSGKVRSMVLAQMGRMALVGGIIGLVAALALGRVARSLLFGMEGHDPLVIAAVGALLGFVALSAAYIPAVRASRVDPSEALRVR